MGVREVRFDDFDGKDGAEQLTITWRDEVYEIDLTEASVGRQLGQVLARARKAGGVSRQPMSEHARATARARELAPIKDWAEQQGLWKRPVRGGILPQSIIEAYHNRDGQ